MGFGNFHFLCDKTQFLATGLWSKDFLAGVTFGLTALYRSHMAICERWNCFIILKASFWDFEFVFGAKVIYFFQRIRIHRNFWRAQKILAFEQKIMKNAIFVLFVARSARARQIFFWDLNSPNPEDEFCTLNESKIVKIDN